MDYIIDSLQEYYGCEITVEHDHTVSSDTQDMIPVTEAGHTFISIDARRLPSDLLIRWDFPGERAFSPEELDHILLCSRMIGQKSAEERYMRNTDTFRQFSSFLGKRSGESIVLFDADDRVIYQNRSSRERRIVNRFERYLIETEDRRVESSSEHTIYLGGTAPLRLDIKNFYSGKSFLGRVISAVSHAGQQQFSPNPETAHDPFLYILGGERSIVKTMQIVRKAAMTDTTVLLRGESGTGKERYARAVHDLSGRKDHPFIPINCAAIPEALLESELFGYEEGSFTGAVKGGKIGKIEAADKGTVFLDEIGDMPPHLQAKLLRVLQERTIERVGGTASVSVDVRFISATHRDLSELMREGSFRPDLYFRLNVIPIHIPPLRNHSHDIEILLSYYLKKYAIQTGQAFSYFSYGALQQLKRYGWPGNIRELENVVQYCMTMTEGDEIGIEDLPPGIIPETEAIPEPDILVTTAGKKKASREEIMRLIDYFGDTTEGKQHAARHLGISTATLYRRLQGGVS